MPTFEIAVADRSTGAERVITLDASSASEARALASTDPAIVIGNVKEKFDGALDDDIDRALNESHSLEYPSSASPAQSDELLGAMQDLLVIQANALNELRQSKDHGDTVAYARSIDRRLRWAQYVALWLLLILPGVGLALSTKVPDLITGGGLMALIGVFLLFSVHRKPPAK